MIFFVVVPVLGSLVLSALAPLIARRAAPSSAARTLAGAAFVMAVANGFTLCVIAGFGLLETPQLLRGRWSADTLADNFHVPVAIALGAGLLAAALLIAAAWHVLRTARALLTAHRNCRHLGPGVYGLVVVDDERVGAYAIPLAGGRTVVSRQLLAALDADERRALLAHEQAHLTHRHFLYVQLAELSASANPLLRPVSATVRRVVEVWADEVAAGATGDRGSVASAMTKAALLKGGPPPPIAALAFDGTADIAYRVDRLLEPARSRTGRWLAVLAGLSTASLISAVVLGLYAHSLFETAERVFTSAR